MKQANLFESFLKVRLPPSPKHLVAVLSAAKTQEEWGVKHEQSLFALDQRAIAAVFFPRIFFFQHIFAACESAIISAMVHHTPISYL